MSAVIRLLVDCKFNSHKKCVERVPDECLGLPASSGLSETGSDAGDMLLENDSALDAMSLDEEREDRANGSTPEDETPPKPQLRSADIRSSEGLIMEKQPITLLLIALTYKSYVLFDKS